ncbi:MAG: hypothetical protein NVSMB32_15370 [Actinomycetota bacterium]
MAVLTEARRVLRPGAPLVISYSNRCFPTKAVLIWRQGNDEDHRLLVRAYLEAAGYTDVADEAPATTDDPLFLAWGR